MCKHSEQNVRRSNLKLFNCVSQFFVHAYSIMCWIDTTKLIFVKKSILQRCIEFACTVGTFPYPWHVASIDSMYLKSQIWELHVLLAFVGICLFTSQILRSKVFNSVNFVLQLTCQNGICSKSSGISWPYDLLGRNYQEKSDPICEHKKSEWAFYFLLIKDLYWFLKCKITDKFIERDRILLSRIHIWYQRKQRVKTHTWICQITCCEKLIWILTFFDKSNGFFYELPFVVKVF